MKKVLLGSTAFVGAAMMFATPALAEWETSWGGFVKSQFAYGDQDEDSAKDRGYAFGVDDFELQFKAKNTSDSGLTYGANFEIENDFASDEVYLYIGSDWGQITLGAQDGATDSMPYSGDFSLVATGGYDGDVGDAYDFVGSVTNPDLLADTGDSAKIIYRSPRFSGVQLQVNYAPDGGQGNTGNAEKDRADTDVGGDADDVFQIGANWVDTINGVDIGIGVAYSTSDPSIGSASGEDDEEGVHVGFNVGFSGFSVGASYGDNFDTGCDAAAGSGCDGGQFWELAGGYSTGPISLGVGYFHGEKDLGGGLDDETEIFSITGQYSLAPGLALYSEFNFIDESTDAGPDNDGTVFMLGASVSF
jgi:hypothetical protein